ncbi:homoserine dehydrogenase-domain-containing protein [Pisolithus croceorrhizus]|nr:homoserine dehydrogenase-domain-containing protein [Pisolithus croceorrhizus]
MYDRKFDVNYTADCGETGGLRDHVRTPGAYIVLRPGHFGQQIHAYAQHVTNSEASSKNCWCSDNLMTRRSKWSSATCCKTIQIKKIGGVFSRMTSYVFNNLSTGRSGGITFSDVVAHANLSKTAALYVYYDSLEPNPMDDLDGADVARKLTVLSSMIDPSMLPLLPQGYKSLDARSLIPPELGSLNGGDEFIQRLPTLRSCERWLQWRDVENKVVKAGLEKSVPLVVFYGINDVLNGSDNNVMFHTERYIPSLPLIVQGAGTSVVVTAMGVMSDLLKLF